MSFGILVSDSVRAGSSSVSMMFDPAYMQSVNVSQWRSMRA
ncbi:MAG: hypothetical protein ACLS74_08555 [Oscillibacter sp.]